MRKRGISLVELLTVLTVLGVLATIALPRLSGQLDSLAVRAAAGDVVSAFALARQAAIARTAYVTVSVDSARRLVTVHTSTDTLMVRPVGLVHGTAIRSNRDSLAYNPLGQGFGGANQSIVVSRGNAIDTVVLSRLGRVRR